MIIRFSNFFRHIDVRMNRQQVEQMRENGASAIPQDIRDKVENYFKTRNIKVFDWDDIIAHEKDTPWDRDILLSPTPKKPFIPEHHIDY